ncbi:hypothetical protein [Rhodanobacter sp. L36]|uniref:hypothetical protein n=1 Tax=Rhodanobacter sp. L36 TaxID=1747221 RepID=UPI00131E02B2|nr:hypothetical protein [Rhodanobacter sp. L36]
MTHAWDSMENNLLDELASIIEVVGRVDVQIRESVQSCRRSEAQRLAAALVNLLEEKRDHGEAMRRNLIDLHDTNQANMASFQRCSDMSIYLLSLLSTRLPIYQRICTRLMGDLGSA